MTTRRFPDRGAKHTGRSRDRPDRVCRRWGTTPFRRGLRRMSHADRVPAAGPQPHPTPETLAAFLEGRLTVAELDALEPHIAACAECCAVLRRLPDDRMVEKLRPARDE